MRYSIRKKNKRIFRFYHWSTLLLVSAFAISVPKAHGEDSIFTARSVFEKLNCSALEILPPSTRMDMLDYWDVDSIYKASNVMEGLSWLESVNPTFLKVRITNVSNLEIKILPDKKELLAMTLYTVGDSIQSEDTQVMFYNQDMELLPVEKHIEMPQLKDFFDIPKGSATKMKEIEQMIPFPTIAITANSQNDDIEARLTVEKYINEDDWNIAKLFVKPSVTLEWNKGKYKIKK
ncbi:MAG: DUF3256 family protein [Muribaculaceae bacterium]|nr:DUF3256 family protein [Muribaculaceae bacterium]